MDDAVVEIAAEMGYSVTHRKITQTSATWRLNRRDGMACEVMAASGKKSHAVRCVPILYRPGYEVALPRVQGSSDKLHDLIEWSETNIGASFERADRLNEVIAKLQELARGAGATQVFEIIPETVGEEVTFGCAYMRRTADALFSVALTATAIDQAIACRSIVTVMNVDGSPGDKLKETVLCKTGMPHEALRGFAKGVIEAEETMKTYKVTARTPYQVLRNDPKAFGDNVVAGKFGNKST